MLDGGSEGCEVARIARQKKAAMTGFRIHHHLLELDDADPLFVRTLHVGRGLALTLVVAAALVAAVATADYFLELSRATRAGLLAAGLAVVLV